MSNGTNEKAGQGHDAPLGHAPGGLDHHEVGVGDGGGAVLPHIGRHVGRHVPERVEGSHGELEQEAAKHRCDTSHRYIFDH